MKLRKVSPFPESTAHLFTGPAGGVMGRAITDLATTEAATAIAGGEVSVLEGTSAGTAGRFLILANYTLRGHE